MEQQISTEVLVVGAGPVGMTSALLMASHGIAVVLIEKNATTADDPKAISLDDESLRVYQRAGMVDQVLPVIVPGTGTSYFDADDQLLFHGGAAVPNRFGFPFKNPFAQPDLEKALRSALEQHPRVDVRFSTELIGLEQDADGVTARVRTPHDDGSIRARAVLAADGGRSAVRALLDIPMSGRSHPDVWLVVDCLEDPHAERYGMHHGDPRRPYVVVAGLHGRCRYEFYLHPGEGEATENPPFELIERLLSPLRPITPQQVERAVSYRFHGLTADRWRDGRVFLLGDAAHMMPPFAGQGLNSGIRDAANLTWKVAAVLRAEAPDALLDTYEHERRAHARAVVRSSERLGRVVMTTNERLARFRDRVVRQALSTREGRDFFEGMRYRPSTRITEGLVLRAERDALAGTSIGQPSVFDFDRRATTPFDDLLGTGWALIGVGLDADQPWAGVAELFPALTPRLVDVPLDDTVRDRPPGVTVTIDLDGRLYAEVDAARGRFLLVRPDRVIAAVLSTDELAHAEQDLGLRLPRDGVPTDHGGARLRALAR
ncbi:bifunctional 3-(3-hydroxy-phenyl)propionate/3-hydroxycinnamic acid hydroxylase [Microbacterium sp.]|uniref:bifunctional 3-(3-hydroxy-phenyl)propionate/3-hydroxycinnamic acid hydroxylase n=1 Tax=Microbacterium sp. TaxID=51671 RepID=UPI0039E2939D